MVKDEQIRIGENVYLGEDSNGNLFLENATNGNRAVLKDDGTFESNLFETDSLNNTHWADTPDEIETIAQGLGDNGGRIKLKPGTYTEADFSGITIPRDHTLSWIDIDCRGCKIDIDSWDGSTMIQVGKGDGTDKNSGSVNIYGLSIDARSVPASDLGTCFEVWVAFLMNFENYIFGEFDIGFHTRSNGGAGHFSHFQGYIRSPDIALQVGDFSDPTECDRSIYEFQNANYRTSCRVEHGGWNKLRIQNEDPDGNKVSPYYGYIVPYHSTDPRINDYNSVELIEASKQFSDEWHLWVENPRTIIDFQGGGQAGLKGGAFATKPSNIISPFWSHEAINPAYDETGKWTTSTGGGSIDITPFSSYNFKTDGTSGDQTSMTMPGALPALDGRGATINTRVEQKGDTYNSFVGFWHNANNYVGYECDPSDGNWHVSMVSGGTSIQDLDTGVSATGSPSQLVINCGLDDFDNSPRQAWIVDEQVRHTTTEDIESFVSQPKVRIETESTGAATTAPFLTMNQFEFGSL